MPNTQKSLVMYHVQDEKKKIQLEVICMSLGLQAKLLRAADLNTQVGKLAEIDGLKLTEVSQDERAPVMFLMPEVIVFSGLASGKLNEFLEAYKNTETENISLKAVVTAQNINWTLYHLIMEIKAEHERLAKT